MGFAKWIGGALGWAMGGPIGGLLGYAFGYIVDDDTFSKKRTGQAQRPGAGGYRPEDEKKYSQYRHHTRPGDFTSALLVLSAAVMKADDKMMRSELEYIRLNFTRNFGPEQAAHQMGLLRELVKKDIPVREVCEQIRYYMEHPMRLQLLHYLFGIARADGEVDKRELQIIQVIAHGLGISDKDYESIRAMFYRDPSASYRILEINESSTNDEVKKAFRKMAVKYHPDKVRHLGTEHQKAAQDKFIEVQQAYEAIKKERGMN